MGSVFSSIVKIKDSFLPSGWAVSTTLWIGHCFDDKKGCIAVLGTIGLSG
jgi:hypothetical protein